MAEFNLEGLLGNVFGGGGNYLDEYLTPEQRAAMQRNAMLAASAALLKAGGESTRRIGIGEALGGAFEAGQAGYEKAQTGALTQMSLKQKLDEAKRAKDLNARLAGIMGASATGEMESPQTTANQLMQAGRAAIQAGDFTRGFDFYRQAREVNPRDEVQGAPFEGTDAEGKPIMLQQMKSGAVRPLAGYGAKPEAAAAPIEVTGPDGKPMLVTPQRGGVYTPVVGYGPKQEALTPEEKQLQRMGQPFNMQTLAALRRAGAAPAADKAPTLTTIVDPTNPNQMLSIDARRYSGGGVGSPGVLGVSGKEPGAATRQVKTEAGKSQLADDLSNLRASFLALDTMKSIPSTQRSALSNITSGISASGIGQRAGQLLGTEAQVERDVINSARSRLVNSIKNATGMSAQQLNSNVELQTMLRSISDPGHSIQAALRIIDDIEKAYVTGSGMAPPAAASQAPAAPAADISQQRRDANAAIAKGAPAAAVRQRFKQNTGQEL